ncbi:MAG: DUF4476 domain-containing protein [Bacteroidota bacterium]
MKNVLYTFFALTVLTLNTYADGFRGKLNIRTFNNQTFIVEIDHSHYNNPSKEFTINDITPGDHKIKIWTIDRCQNQNYGTIGNYNLTFNGFINVPARTKVKALLTYQNILKVVSIEPLDYSFHQECNNNITHSNYYGGNGYYTNNSYYDNNGHCDNHNSYSTGQHNGYNVYPNNYNNAFCEVKELIALQKFDDTRLAICKQYIKTNNINSTQLKELLTLITFESNRVELAKYGYRYVSDPGYFYTVYNVFTFDSSINELINWINHQS